MLLLWLTPSVIRTLHYCLSSIQSQLRLMFSLQETKICLWTTLHLFMYATVQKGTSVLSFISKFIKIYNCHVTPFFITKNYLMSKYFVLILKHFCVSMCFCAQKASREADNYSQFPRLSLHSIKLLKIVSLPANDLPE